MRQINLFFVIFCNKKKLSSPKIGFVNRNCSLVYNPLSIWPFHCRKMLLKFSCLKLYHFQMIYYCIKGVENTHRIFHCSSTSRVDNMLLFSFLMQRRCVAGERKVNLLPLVVKLSTAPHPRTWLCLAALRFSSATMQRGLFIN